MRNVLLLGASGSIGTQSLDIIASEPSAFCLRGISVGKQVGKIPNILDKFPTIEHVCVQEHEECRKLRKQYPSIVWHHGDEGLKQIIVQCECDMVINALVGFAGLIPSIISLEENKILCLANKESLVVGGKLIQAILSEGKGKIYPIDSEHVAIAKMMAIVKPQDVDKILITASGGSFRNKTRAELKNVTPADALAHPTWKMGAKITIDSATMMNKGFEVLEAKWLFDFPLDRTEIIMHDESHVHSMLLMKDGTYLADISKPDMHGPISYALHEGKIDFKLVKANKMEDLGPYHFHEFDPKRYTAPSVALYAFYRGGNATAVLNGANEEAVYAFLDGKLPFLRIEEIVADAINDVPYVEFPTLADIVESDRLAREYVKDIVELLEVKE